MHYQGCIIEQDELFDAELILKLVQNMGNGKAAGLDELTVEYIKYCHLIIKCVLYKLFNLFIDTGNITEDFRASYTVHIPKCDGRVRALSVDDFRVISISRHLHQPSHLHQSSSPAAQSSPNYLKWLFICSYFYCNLVLLTVIWRNKDVYLYISNIPQEDFYWPGSIIINMKYSISKLLLTWLKSKTREIRSSVILSILRLFSAALKR